MLPQNLYISSARLQVIKVNSIINHESQFPTGNPKFCADIRTVETEYPSQP